MPSNHIGVSATVDLIPIHSRIIPKSLQRVAEIPGGHTLRASGVSAVSISEMKDLVHRRKEKSSKTEMKGLENMVPAHKHITSKVHDLTSTIAVAGLVLGPTVLMFLRAQTHHKLSLGSRESLCSLAPPLYGCGGLFPLARRDSDGLNHHRVILLGSGLGCSLE